MKGVPLSNRRHAKDQDTFSAIKANVTKGVNWTSELVVEYSSPNVVPRFSLLQVGDNPGNDVAPPPG